MEQREKLIELIIESVQGCARHWAEIIADHLIENGAIVPPCKVGDTVWIIVYGFSKPLKGRVCFFIAFEHFFVVNCAVEGYYAHEYSSEDFGKTVFLTRDEAEKALAERSGK